MTTPADETPPTIASTPRSVRVIGPAPSKVRSPLHFAALCLGSLAIMTPWPLLGILLLRSQFDQPTEAFLFLGGITMFPLMILALFGSVPESTLLVIVSLVWLAAATVPNFWFRRRLRSWSAVAGLLGAQAGFSLAQALMGALLIIGKSV